jgi:general secretion pathway protein G
MMTTMKLHPPTSARRSILRPASSRGFTLMEMILVLAIISTLLGLVIFKMVNVTEDANITKAKADIKAMDTNLLRYKTRNGRLPTQAEGLEIMTTKGASQLVKPEGIIDPWAHPYQYRNPGKVNPSGYDVYSMGPDGQDGTADDIYD